MPRGGQEGTSGVVVVCLEPKVRHQHTSTTTQLSSNLGQLKDNTFGIIRGFYYPEKVKGYLLYY